MKALNIIMTIACFFIVTILAAGARMGFIPPSETVNQLILIDYIVGFVSAVLYYLILNHSAK